MKLLLKFIVCIAVFTTALNSCKKTSIFDEQGNLENDSEFNAKNIKTWYYKTFENSAEGKLTGTDKKYPVWKNGIYYKFSNFEVFEFPLIKNRKETSVPSNLSLADKKRVTESSLIKIRFVKDKEGKITVIEVNYIPEIQYLRNNNYDISNVAMGKANSDFTGKMILKKWSGELINKFFYRNGEFKGKIKDNNFATSRENSTTSSQGSCADGQEEVCIMIEECDVYPDGLWTNCQDLGIEEGSCTCEGIPDETTNPCLNLPAELCNCEQIGTCGGGGQGGGGSSNNVLVMSVTETINPNFPCLKDAFNSVTSSLLTNCINQLYQDTYVGTNKIHNLEVTTVPNLFAPNGDEVESKSRVKDNEINTYEIALNSNFGHDFTEEFWSSVILHELVHSFIQKNNLNFTPTAQFTNAHEIMLTKWVNRIKEALMEIYPGMTENDALCLSINGMSDILKMDVTNTFKNDMILFMEQHYNQNATTLGSTATAYKSGTKGTICN